MSAQIKTSADFERICALARRPMPGTPQATRQAEDDNREFSNLMLTREGRRAGAHLQGYQGFSLRELHEQGGAYLSLPVGSGKTLISRQAAVVLDARRPLLVIPASLRDKTYAEFYEYSKHWVSPGPDVKLRIMSYNDLTKDENVTLLSELQPDLYIFDEVDKLSNQEASAAQRIGRDVDARLPAVLAMTGTGSRHSIQDFTHFLTWALKDRAPVPLDHDELDKWSLALDAKIGWTKRRMGPGVLHDLARVYQHQIDIFDQWDLDIDETVWARLAFQNRLNETPGVVILDEDSCDQPLTISLVCAPEDRKLNGIFERYYETEKTPDGWDLPTSLERWTFEQTLGAGFYFIYDPRPPFKWCEARRQWHKFVRSAIKWSRRSRRPLDTEKAVKKAFRDHEEVRAWEAAEAWRKREFGELNSVPVWLSDSTVHFAARWAREHTALVFVANETLGLRIAEAAGLRYYGAGGLDVEGGGSIENAPTGRSAVLSIAANMRGRNLQGWREALVIGCPQSARDLEQLIGRLHRYGQKHHVHFTILLTSGLGEYSFNAAMREAQFVLQTQGQTQKILRSGIKRTRYPSGALRWTRDLANAA